MHKILLVCLLLMSKVGLAVSELRIYNWSDYIAPTTISTFEKQTDVKVSYDLFDSNEVLEAKLLAGSSGFDIVVPSANPFLGRQIKADVYMKLDKHQLPNYKNLDERILKILQSVDPKNEYAIPYLWGTVGMGVNVEQVKKILGSDVPLNSWDLLFKTENLSRLTQCGVAFLDSPSDIMALTLFYLGLNPHSESIEDIQGPVKQKLMSLRPYITYFHTSKYINDLANGDICVALGWSGDVLQAINRARDAKKSFELVYIVPKEGSLVWVDTMAIPKDAPDPKTAHEFLNYVMEPQVIAEITNFVQYANANKMAFPLVREALRQNEGVYPDDKTMATLFTAHPLSPRVGRVIGRVWATVKTGY